MWPELLFQARDLMVQGGGVMPPLVLISLLMWLLILHKEVYFYQARRQEKSLLQCWNELEHQRVVGADWQQTVLKQFSWLRQTGTLNRESLMQLQRSEEIRIKRFVQSIQVLAGAAPLLGLLGTVGGMITTFDVISVFGTGNARAMAAGISEALISTQTGLVVAVPGLVVGALLRRRSERLNERMQGFSLGLLQKASN